jgi:hypothetical protein
MLGDPFAVSQRDSQFYVCNYTSPTTCTLSVPYAGTSGSGKNWVISSNSTSGSNNAWIGFGTQPFMQGINGWLYWFTNQAFSAGGTAYSTQAAQALGYVADAANWISKSTMDGSGGTDPATRGAFYGVGFGQCTPGSDSNGCRCGPNNNNCPSVAASRENMGEALGELAQGYVTSPSSALQTAIDNVYSACYAKFPTDPGYDGTYCQDYDGFFLPTNNGKWLGFMLGMGRNAGWPSARQGGVAPPVRRPVVVNFNLASVSAATQVLVTLIEPAGNIVEATCSTSPCLVQTDTTQGNPLVTIAYLSSGGQVLASSSQRFPVGVQ